MQYCSALTLNCIHQYFIKVNDFAAFCCAFKNAKYQEMVYLLKEKSMCMCAWGGLVVKVHLRILKMTYTPY